MWYQIKSHFWQFSHTETPNSEQTIKYRVSPFHDKASAMINNSCVPLQWLISDPQACLAIVKLIIDLYTGVLKDTGNPLFPHGRMSNETLPFHLIYLKCVCVRERASFSCFHKSNKTVTQTAARNKRRREKRHLSLRSGSAGSGQTLITWPILGNVKGREVAWHLKATPPPWK